MSNLIIPEDAADPADMPHDAVFEHCEAVAWGDYDPSCEPYSRYLSGPEVVTSPDRVLGTEIVRRVELGARDSQGRVVPWERRSALERFRKFIASLKKSPGGLFKSDGSYVPMDGEVLASPNVWRRIELGWFESEDPEGFGQYVFDRIHVDRWFARQKTSAFAWEDAITVDWEIGPWLRYLIRKSHEYDGFLRTHPQTKQIAGRLSADWKKDGVRGLNLSERTADLLAMVLQLSPRSSPSTASAAKSSKDAVG